jgi:uncharacterized protein (DUF302 family)
MRSPHDAAETVERLESALKEKQIHVFARIDHAAGAASVGLRLPPTTVLIFGNPQVGTALMQSNQTIGIDLPLKMLVWQDDKKDTWLAYNDPAYLARRHGVHDQEGTITAMAAALKGLARAATAPGG